jgi:phage replication O-like protein O
MTASPQVEDGYTRIANELLEAMLLARLSSRQWCVVMALARKTYGYNKKTDDIGLSQLVDLTGLAKPHLSVAVRELEERRIITRKQGAFGHIMGINKEYQKWDRVTESVTVTESVKKGYRIGKAGVTESVTTKDNPTKETQKKIPREEISFKKWIAKCQTEDKKPIPEDDPVFSYAAEQRISIDFIRYAWVEFKRKYIDTRKLYKNWNQHFQNAVRENWYGIWYEKNGEWMLTTRGKQIENEIKAKIL